MDELRKRLKEQTVGQLKSIAKQLGLKNYSDLNKEPLIDFILENGNHEELKKHLGMAAGKSRKKGIGFWAAIASIIGVILAVVFYLFPPSQNAEDEDYKAFMYELRKKIEDPEIIKELEKKYKETAREFKQFKG